MNGITFSRICGGYLLMGFLLAILISPEYSGPGFLSPSLTLLPFVNLFQSPDNHLASISVFFMIMWAFMPVVLFLLAKHPQKNLPIYSKKSGVVLLYATAIAAALFLLMASAFYLKVEITAPVARGSAIIMLAAKYRIFLGIVGGAFMVATAISTYIFFVLIPKLWIGYFSKDN